MSSSVEVDGDAGGESVWMNELNQVLQGGTHYGGQPAAMYVSH